MQASQHASNVPAAHELITSNPSEHLKVPRELAARERVLWTVASISDACTVDSRAHWPTLGSLLPYTQPNCNDGHLAFQSAHQQPKE